MKNHKYVSLALAMVGLFAATASAVQIQGRIDFGGGVQLDAAPATADAFVSFGSVTVSSIPFIPSPTGDYATTAGASVTMKPFTFNGFVGPLVDVWKFSSGGLDYSFDLLGISSVTQGTSGVAVVGFGTAYITGFTPTSGLFTVSTQTAGTNNVFSFSATSVVPDAGSSVAMLGLGLLALVGIRRVFSV